MKNFIILLLLLGGAVTLNSCQKEEDNWAEELLLDNHGRTTVKKVYKNVTFVSDTFIPFKCCVFTFADGAHKYARTFGLTVRSATVIPLKDTRLIKLVLMKFIKSRWERRHPG